MKKMLALILLMTLMTVSCDKSGDGSPTDDGTIITDPVTDGGDTDPGTDPEPGTPTEPDAPPVNTDVPNEALTFDANVDYMNLTATQEEKYNKAVELVKKVVATEAFRKQVLNHTYAGVKQYVDNRGRTNAQIYQSILDAAETLKPVKNNTMDLGVKMYYTNNSVVGYTNPSITYINVNTKFFNNYDINEVAGNLFHEWLHKVGYGHDSAATARRPYSVPYAVGYMIRSIGKNFL